MKLDKEYIKKYYPITDIAKRLGLKIDKNNKAICPFHNDKNPSLSFNTKENYYHCFSCGASGDNIKLVKEILHCNFKEAIEFISGIKYQNNEIISNNYNIENAEKKQNNKFTDIYNNFIELLENKDAVEYFEKRRLTKKQVYENKIKNIPNNKKAQYNIIKKLLKLHSKEALLDSGIISKSMQYNSLYLTHYKHRLIMPYFNIDGQSINSIQGRSIDEEIKPKYLFNKNAEDSIYNIHKLNDIKDIIICEGAIDALSLERMGYCALALSGASKGNIIQKYSILNNYNIYSFSDNDKAGNKLIKDIYKLDNYKGSFLLGSFTQDKNIKDINELLVKSNIKTFKIENIEYNYFEMPNDRICILDYYVFTKNELKHIKEEADFNRALYNFMMDKKKLTEKEYKQKYGELN